MYVASKKRKLLLSLVCLFVCLFVSFCEQINAKTPTIPLSAESA